MYEAVRFFKSGGDLRGRKMVSGILLVKEAYPGAEGRIVDQPAQQ